MKNRSHLLDIAYVLLTADRPLSTVEITDKVGCERKTVYAAVDAMELAGFKTNIRRKGKGSNVNTYEAKLR